jgi:hypothetical protein
MLLFVSAALLASPALVCAQGAPPARETPRPQDVDPGVNTSAPSQAPAGDSAARGASTRDSRPEDVDPAVNTSAAAPASESSGASSSTPASPAGSGASARATASGAAKSATPNAGRTAAPNSGTAPNTAASPSAPNTAAPNAGTASPASAKATASTKPAVGPDGKPAKGKAVDRLELDTTQITGNRELPKVLYIVPWKRSDLGDLTGKPVNSLIDEVLTPVDRDVFKRENRYYRALEAAPANGNSAPASGTSPASATEGGSANPAARDER